MVDDLHRIGNRVDDQVPAWQLALLLLGGFRELVDETHALLSQRGHPDVRPVHGFVLQAVGEGTSASEVAARLGVSRQAATKTLNVLEAEGYVSRTTDPADSRRLVVTATERGRDLLLASEAAFEDALGRWRQVVGGEDVALLGRVLTRLELPAAARLDLGAWSG